MTPEKAAREREEFVNEMSILVDDGGEPIFSEGYLKKIYNSDMWEYYLKLKRDRKINNILDDR